MTHELGLVIWAGVGGIVVVLAALSITHRKIPTARAMLHAMTGNAAGRAAVLMGWLWLGWHLFVRR